MKPQYLFFSLFLVLTSCEDEEPRFCYSCTFQYDYEDGTQDISYYYENDCVMMTDESARDFVGFKSATKNLTYNKKGTRTVIECVKQE